MFIKKIASLMLAIVIPVGTLAGCTEKTSSTTQNESVSQNEKEHSEEITQLLSLAPAPESDFDYEYDSDLNGVVINSYNGTDWNLRIPDEIKGEKVVCVKYLKSSDFKMIYFPSTVTKIGNSGPVASSVQCTNAPFINDIPYCIVEDISKLNTLYIDDSVTTIEAMAFSNCSGLKNVTISDGVTTIEALAFLNCPELTNITIPKSVTKISHQAFAFCKGLTNVAIPNSVSVIGNGCFESCVSLTSVTIPSSVTEMGDSSFPFVNCTNLKEINVDQNNRNYCSVDGVVYNKDKSKIVCYPNANGSEYTILDTVTEISRTAFGGCTNLKSVIIPDSVTEIGASAFGGCSGLTNISIPDGVDKIGDLAFCGCTGLTSINVPDSVTYLSENAFENCPNVQVRYNGKTYSYDNISELYNAINV